MGRWGKTATGAVATAIVMGLVSLSPAVAQAAVCGGNAHVNTHVNEHVNTHVNEHVNAHVNEHVNAHVNEHVNAHVNEHVNAHVNEHVNQHVNTHVNEHVNAHVNEHVNAHVNEHVNAHVNEHVNAHVNQHVNQHVNAHVNEHVNVHVNEHVNEHLNVHVNEHVNTHVNEHLNTHVNEHLNVHVNEHVNAHVNGHLNAHVNEHVNEHINQGAVVELSQSEQDLLTALQSLHCNRVDYLYAYFENVHFTETQIINISTNVSKIAALCGHSTNLSQLTLAQRQEVWQLFVSTFSVCGLHVTVQDNSGHAVNILNQRTGTAVSLQVKDETGHELCTVPLTNSSSPTSYVKASQSLEQASKATTHLNASNISDTTVTGKLPQTSTHDPLLIAFGLLLAALGAAGLILGFRLSRRS